MGYVKVVKNNQYFKRYQVKMRRRRQCKTNYRLRRRMIKQDKRKYNAPKWRFIVRISNGDVVCQVACPKMVGDQIICAAYSHELQRYGLKVGLTNYAACYCTGLLLARRVLKKLGLDKYYPGKKSLDGNMFKSAAANVSWGDKRIRRPFKCILDIGLARATSGARVFAALKGAVDGGLDIPHSNKRFPGFTKGGKDMKDEYDAEVHREKIFGGHVADYMRHLQEHDGEKYEKHFSQYIKAGVAADDLEDLYKKVHRAIRKEPKAPPKKKRDWRTMEVRVKPKKLTKEQRDQRRLERIEELRKAAAATEGETGGADPMDED